MADAKELADWDIASTIVGMLEKCQTGDANHIVFNPDRWHFPKEREAQLQRQKLREQQEREYQAALADPVKRAEIVALKRAAWMAWQKGLR